MTRIPVTEESKIHEEWFKEASNITIDTLGDFVKKLTNDYEHDYGTIVHAMAAAVGATITAMNNAEQGGITGFQASCLMWEILGKEFQIGWPVKLVRYKNMLYPQYEDHFNAIPYDIWVWLREQAATFIQNDFELAPEVKRHMKSISEGHVPFGLRISKKDE